MAAPTSANLIKNAQRIDFASLEYRCADNDEWTRLDDAYTIKGAKAKKFEVRYNICDLILDGDIRICQQAEDYQPHLPPQGNLQNDRVRWQVTFRAGTYDNIILQEYESQEKTFWIIAIHFTCRTKPESTNDTRYANSGTSAERPDHNASELPLAQWAGNYSDVGVKEVRLVFRRDNAKKGLKEWLWPAVFQFLSGGREWSPSYNIGIQQAVFRLHLTELANHPRHGHQLQRDGDTYRLRSAMPPPNPSTSVASSSSSDPPKSSHPSISSWNEFASPVVPAFGDFSQQLPIVGKRPSPHPDISTSMMREGDRKRQKLDRPVSPHLQNREGNYEGNIALEIAYREGVAAGRLSEINNREKELERLRTEYQNDLAKIEELKNAKQRMDT